MKKILTEIKEKSEGVYTSLQSSGASNTHLEMIVTRQTSLRGYIWLEFLI